MRFFRLALLLAAYLALTSSGGLASAQPPSSDAVEIPDPEAPRTEIVALFYDRIPLRWEGAAAPPRGRRNLEIRYRALDVPPESVRFAFRMEGLEDGWAQVGARSTAYYRDLEPGTYTFQVRAARPGSGWGPATELPVVVDRYLYEEPWVIALGVLLVLGLALGGHQWQLRQARSRAAILERLVDERTHDLHVENRRVEAALSLAETERTTAQEAHETVEEQAIQLLRMDHMKSRLFANISHEFRTPLTLILDPLDRAASGGFGPLPDEASHALGRARENAHRLLDLINQLLDLAKFEGGSMELQAQEHDLVPFLRRSTEIFASEASRRGIDLRFVADVPHLRAWVDAQKMETVIHNLLTNALKATGKGGKTILSVRTAPLGEGAEAGRASDGVAEITVRDTGEGIDEAERPFVFDRFYQAETGRLKGGTGIGLSLVREIADLHHGTIAVESLPGFGSTFTLRLPLGCAHLAAHEMRGGEAELRALPPEPAPARPDAPAYPAEDTAHRPLVLVVEDNAEIRQLIVGHLRPFYRIAEAEEGAAALQVARARRPALVVSDVLMPGMDGLALCRQLKADSVLGDTPVILLTARASSDDRLEALRTGADDFLTKPFAASELQARVANLIQLRSALRDRYSDKVVLPTTGQAVPSADAAFLERVYLAVDAHLADEGLTVGHLAAEVGMSESSLKRRLRTLVEVSPVEFVRLRRLERAAALLLGEAGTVSEVAAQVGFGSPSYFARCFRDRYGVSPSAYLSQDEAPVAEA